MLLSRSDGQSQRDAGRVDDSRARSGATDGRDIPAQGGERETPARSRAYEAAVAANAAEGQRLKAACAGPVGGECDPPEWLKFADRFERTAGQGRGTFRKVAQLREWAINGHEGFTRQGIDTPLGRVAAMEAGYDVLLDRGELSPLPLWVVEQGCKAAASRKQQAPTMRELKAAPRMPRNTGGGSAFRKMMEMGT